MTWLPPSHPSACEQAASGSTALALVRAPPAQRIFSFHQPMRWRLTASLATPDPASAPPPRTATPAAITIGKMVPGPKAKTPVRPWLARLADAIVPTVHANEPGCDGFHWLDYTIFRPCCDLHDRCYAKYGCTWHTWWEVWSSWRCDACNIGFAFCIMTRYPPYSPSYP